MQARLGPVRGRSLRERAPKSETHGRERAAQNSATSIALTLLQWFRFVPLGRPFCGGWLD